MDETNACAICEVPNSPPILVEVSSDGEDRQWIAVCSEECLQQVVIQWKQIAEIVTLCMD